MAIVGRSAAIRSRRALSAPDSTSRCIDAPNAPTPGSMTWLAARMRAGSLLTSGSASSRRNAATTEARFAVPVGTMTSSVTALAAAALGHGHALEDLVQRKAHADRRQV